MRHYPPFHRFLGITVADDDPDIKLARRDELLNSHGALHGGVILSLIDAAMSRAIRLQAGVPIRLSTIDLTVHFLVPATGDTVRATGTVLKMGSHVTYAQAVVQTPDGQTVAVGSGAFRTSPG
jgi:uncharacterized protein (TIGR00369 family)